MSDFFINRFNEIIPLFSSLQIRENYDIIFIEKLLHQFSYSSLTLQLVITCKRFIYDCFPFRMLFDVCKNIRTEGK